MNHITLFFPKPQLVKSNKLSAITPVILSLSNVHLPCTTPPKFQLQYSPLLQLWSCRHDLPKSGTGVVGVGVVGPGVVGTGVVGPGAHYLQLIDHHTSI